MKKNWLVPQTFVAFFAALICGNCAEPVLAQPPNFAAMGSPLNSIIALEIGRADAAHDVSNGALRVPMYGLPSVWLSEYNRILQEKYGVERYGLGGCVGSPGLDEYARGYREISSTVIEQKFGSNFFERVEAEAKQAFEQRIQETAKANAAPAKRTYRVKAGDTFWDIARQNRVPVSSLVAANPGVRPERLQINYSLNLPSADRP